MARGLFPEILASETLPDITKLMRYAGTADMVAIVGDALIVNNIGPTAQIDAIIKPIYNFKAGD